MKNCIELNVWKPLPSFGFIILSSALVKRWSFYTTFKMWSVNFQVLKYLRNREDTCFLSFTSACLSLVGRDNSTVSSGLIKRAFTCPSHSEDSFLPAQTCHLPNRPYTSIQYPPCAGDTACSPWSQLLKSRPGSEGSQRVTSHRKTFNFNPLPTST